jgi:hypothetical protein
VKKIIFVVIMMLSTMVFISCNEKISIPLEQSDSYQLIIEAAQAESDTIEPVIDNVTETWQMEVEQDESNGNDEYTFEDDIFESNVVDIGGYEEFLDVFIDPVNRFSIIFDIIGLDETNKFIRNEIVPILFDRIKVPVLYMAIQYFSIPKEVFIEYNEKAITFNAERGTSAATYEDWMIDALYHEDKDEMIRLLLTPTSLYADGRVYHFLEVALSSEEWRNETFDLNEEEWDEYVLDVVELIGDRTGEYWEGIIESLDRDGSRRRRGGNRGN